MCAFLFSKPPEISLTPRCGMFSGFIMCDLKQNIASLGSDNNHMNNRAFEVRLLITKLYSFRSELCWPHCQIQWNRNTVLLTTIIRHTISLNLHCTEVLCSISIYCMILHYTRLRSVTSLERICSSVMKINLQLWSFSVWIKGENDSVIKYYTYVKTSCMQKLTT